MIGLLLGGAAFLLAPLPIGPDAHAGVLAGSAAPTVAAATPAPISPGPISAAPTRPGSADPSSPSTARPATPAGPAFTERALLQTSELLEHGWARAAELSLDQGPATASALRCVDVASLPQEPLATFGATYQGLHTQAAEQVARYAGRDVATGAFDRLATQVGSCDSAARGVRLAVGKRYDPDLPGISQATWWKVSGTEPGDRTRGVVGLVRVEDRLSVVYLHSTSTDPAVTTDFVPLLRQAGLRLV